MKTVTLGLSTHRNIAPEAVDAVNASAYRYLESVKADCEAKGEQLVMLNSLAEGGDTLLAKAALSLGIPYIAVLPRKKASYAADFEGKALDDFLFLCDKAKTVMVSPDIEQENDTTLDYTYRQAGIYVAAASDIFLALWDGVPGKPNGCGAAEAYAFAGVGGYRDPTGAYPLKKRTLCHILTPRPGQPTDHAGEIHIFQT